MAERPIAEGVIRFTPDARSLANVEKSVKKAIGRIEGISARGGLLAKNYVQPLGQITGAADEFTKSLEASNASRVFPKTLAVKPSKFPEA